MSAIWRGYFENLLVLVCLRVDKFVCHASEAKHIFIPFWDWNEAHLLNALKVVPTSLTDVMCIQAVPVPRMEGYGGEGTIPTDEVEWHVHPARLYHTARHRVRLPGLSQRYLYLQPDRC